MTNRPSSRSRYAFLDGLRGLAALYVVLFHTRAEYDLGAPLHKFASRSSDIATLWMAHGHLAVDVFIVLSGFCLMLPVAGSPDDKLKGGVGGYLKRRARRILPPYYAALALAFIPLIAAHFVGGSHFESAGWRYNFTAFPIITHLLLIHNLFLQTNTLYDPPMWSVSTEWEIYFIFPMLLWLRQRTNIWLATALAIFAGLLPHFLLPHYNLDWASPWFLGLFAMGMLAATISSSDSDSFTKLRANLPWGIVCLVFFIPGFLLGIGAAHETSWKADLLIGAATGALLVSCAREVRRRKLAEESAENTVNPSTNSRHLVLDLLSAKWPVNLGVFSYSLYLTHSLIIIYYARFLQNHTKHLLVAPASFFTVCTLVSLGYAYLFFLVVEQRFLPGHVHTQRRNVLGAALEPAP